MKKTIIIIISIILILSLGGCIVSGVLLYNVYSGLTAEAKDAQFIEDPDTFIENMREHISPSTQKGYSKIVLDDGVVYTICVYTDGRKLYIDTTGNPTTTEKVLLKVSREYAYKIDSILGIDND